MTIPFEGWKTSPVRAELQNLYARADALVFGGSCACDPSNGPVELSTVECCHFAVTGREPYPTAVELAEVHHAVTSSGLQSRVREPKGRGRSSLPVVDDARRCPLLDDKGRCRIYASRPLGCRTFFCGKADVRLPRKEIQAVSNSIADLSARVFPRDPGPRPLVRALGTAFESRSRRP